MSDTSAPETLQRTPLYDEHLALGGRMVPFAGFEMPVQYAGILEEHHATRASAGIFDISHMAEFRVSGPDAKAFLQASLSNDLDKIDDIGAAQYTLLLDDEGHIIDDLIVYNTGNEYFIIANASNRHHDFNWLSERVHTPKVFDVSLVDESDRTALIALQGPKSIAILRELAGEGWEVPARFHIAEAVLNESIPVLVARTGYTGEDGVELVVRNEDAPALWRMLLSFPEVSPVGLGARDTLRLEMGYHLYGNDMNRTRGPIEAGLGWVCPKGKTGYCGCENVAKARSEGVGEKLAHLTVTGGVPREGYPVLNEEGERIGVIASGSHSPTLCTGIATAYIPASYVVAGTKLQVQIRKRLGQATVVKPPFLQRAEG
ncbi:MAG: glycine cleavage system aminomethyltransferase GcvT [Actinomycetes bacterium]|jgi:aminomethyltransferase|nr:glycine cleavage system aminomethyltransferase GcvT [Actinomycetes bacterium]